MSTNIQIEEKLKHIINFKGCFPINQIPKLNIKESVIINSDDDTEDGTHWMALKIISKKTCLFLIALENLQIKVSSIFFQTNLGK